MSAGAGAVFEAIAKAAYAAGLDILQVATGCIGYCQQEPVVHVRMPGMGSVLYTPMTPGPGERLIAALSGGELPADHALAVIPGTGSSRHQHQGVLSRLPLIDDLPF